MAKRQGRGGGPPTGGRRRQGGRNREGVPGHGGQGVWFSAPRVCLTSSQLRHLASDVQRTEDFAPITPGRSFVDKTRAVVSLLHDELSVVGVLLGHRRPTVKQVILTVYSPFDTYVVSLHISAEERANIGVLLELNDRNKSRLSLKTAFLFHGVEPGPGMFRTLLNELTHSPNCARTVSSFCVGAIVSCIRDPFGCASLASSLSVVCLAASSYSVSTMRRRDDAARGTTGIALHEVRACALTVAAAGGWLTMTSPL